MQEKLPTNIDVNQLLSRGFHPVFNIKNGECIMEPGCVYESYFKNTSYGNFKTLNDSRHIVKNEDLLLYLYKDDCVEKHIIKPDIIELTKFYFLIDSKIVHFRTQNRFKSCERWDTYMFWFRKII